MYFDGRREYEGKMEEAKLKSWKTFCTVCDGVNPWNLVYKVASGKIRTTTRLTTLEKEDGKYTTDTRSTILHMLEHFAPDDREDSDNELHREIWKEIQKPLDTADDKAFTKEEIIAVLKKFSPKKSPGLDGLTIDILIRVFQVFPLFYTQIFNACLKEGCFPKKCNHSVIIPIIIAASGVETRVVVWIGEFLRDCSQRVRLVGHYSEEVRVTSGVPQGSVLGPILFLAYINDISTNIKSEIRLFADDCIIYRKIQNIKDVEKLQDDLYRLGNGRKKTKC